MAIEEGLIPALERLHTALVAKEQELWPVVKTGRTHLQDATPIRLGQEFRGYAGQVEASLRRAKAAQAELLIVPLGGTAVGTGINAHPEYAFRACARLSSLTGLDVRETDNHFHAQATLDAAIAAHGAVRTIALSLWKIASDLRLMGMGPRAGLGEIALPETQPGSSIMPGKVNPVIIESLTMVVARVVGNDATVAFGQTGSFLELNVMLPVTAVALLESIDLLSAATANFSARAVEGLTATERGPQLVEQGLMLATALAPVIGYDEAARLAKEALKSGRTIRELALERGMDPADLDRLLDPASDDRARPRWRSGRRLTPRRGVTTRTRSDRSSRIARATGRSRWPSTPPRRPASRRPRDEHRHATRGDQAADRRVPRHDECGPDERGAHDGQRLGSRKAWLVGPARHGRDQGDDPGRMSDDGDRSREPKGAGAGVTGPKRTAEDGDRQGGDGDDCQRDDLEKVARPVRRRRPEQDSGRDDRPEATAEERCHGRRS